jgi:hypothetical protein
MENKYLPNNKNKAINHKGTGFGFGDNILSVEAGYEILRYSNAGRCNVGKNKYYDIEADEYGNSPLTGEKDNFSCKNIEVFKIIPRKSKKHRDDNSSEINKEEEAAE